MKITVIGGGPGGLYLALLTKKARPDWKIEVYEQNQADVLALFDELDELTREPFAKMKQEIDSLLAECGSNKSKLLSAQIWLSDIGTFADMNSVWDAWIDPENPPCRACVESKLAAPQYVVEIMVTAAK